MGHIALETSASRRIGIHGQTDLTVTEHLLHDLWMLLIGQHSARECVPQVVKANGGYPRTFQERLERTTQRVAALKRRPEHHAEHEVTVCLQRPRGEPLFKLIGTVLP